MIGRTILHYKIIEKLGEGGMGVVYLAEDTRLERKVAIKFLPRHIAASKEERQRFEIEAKAAAALNHPNIATIYAIEEADDPQRSREVFIVMEYIEGQELKDVIASVGVVRAKHSQHNIFSEQKDDARNASPQRPQETRLPINQIINIAIQIAEGLQAAHEKGVVHRDIKSSNIMITNKGQVKIMDFGLAKIRGGSQETKEGITAGTLAYMSPEQAQGVEVDQRTDIWSLGVVLYEMLTGQLPFKGDYEQAILYTIVNEEPVAHQALRPEVPESLAQVIMQMLAKKPEKRFQNMPEVLTALEHTAQLLQHAPTDKKEKTSSIAVLPFTDMSASRDQEYFCEGVAEEILNSLSRIEGLRVTSRTFSFQLRETGQDIREIGKRFNVDSVLEGSVRKAGKRLRVNVRLTNVSDGFHLWSERYDRNLEDIFAIQDDIAKNVATALRGVLTRREKEDLRRPETAIETYEYFLKGRQLLHQLALEDALTMFRKAIELDDSYAPAYAGLANTQSLIYEWRNGKPEDLEAADRTSCKALELAPHLTESHTARGFVLSLREHFDEAEQAFQEAIRLDPNSFDAYYYYARTCFARGETARSVELFRKAGDVRREDFQSMVLLAQSLDMLGREKEARKADREAIRRVEHQLELDPTDRRALSLGAFSLYNEGQQERSFQWIEKALELYPNDVSVLTNSACLKARAGMKEEALELLEPVFSQGFGQRSWIEHDPDYDSLRDDPRFLALLEKLR